MTSNHSDAIQLLTTGGLLEMWEAAKAIASQEDLSIVPRLIELMDGTFELERRIAAARGARSSRSPTSSAWISANAREGLAQTARRASWAAQEPGAATGPR